MVPVFWFEKSFMHVVKTHKLKKTSFFTFLKICLFERRRAQGGGGAQRERERES